MSALSRNGRISRKSRLFLGLLMVCVAMGVLTAGCQKEAVSPDSEKPSPASSNGAEPLTPEARLHEQLRSGMFQMDAAAGSIEECRFAVQEVWAKAKGNTKSAMQDVLEWIDSAGAEVADYADEPPAAGEIAAAFGAWDEKRLKAIAAGNDAMHDLREAAGTLEELSDTPLQKQAQDLRALVLVALDDLWGAIEALGGKPEAEDPPVAP